MDMNDKMIDQIMGGVPADDTLLIMRHICENDLELRLDCFDGEKGYAICKRGGVLVSGTDIDYLLDDYKQNHMK